MQTKVGADVTQLEILHQDQWCRLIPKNKELEEGARNAEQTRVDADVTQLEILQQE